MADTASPIVSESTTVLSLWSLVVQLQGNAVTLTTPTYNVAPAVSLPILPSPRPRPPCSMGMLHR